MSVRITEHAVDRYRERVRPDLSYFGAEALLRDAVKSSKPMKQRTKHGQLQYLMADGNRLIVKETEYGLMLVTIYTVKQEVEEPSGEQEPAPAPDTPSPLYLADQVRLLTAENARLAAALKQAAGAPKTATTIAALRCDLDYRQQQMAMLATRVAAANAQLQAVLTTAGSPPELANVMRAYQSILEEIFSTTVAPSNSTE